MTYIASLRLRFVALFDQLREWRQRSLDAYSRDRDNGPDDLYEIFLFGPHG